MLRLSKEAFKLAIGKRRAVHHGHSRAKLAAFILTSGIGLIISLVMYALLYGVVKLSAFYANFIADFLAITYVFIISWRGIFLHNNRRFVEKLTMYILARFLSIFIFSTINAVVLGYVLLLRGDSLNIPDTTIAVLVKLLFTPLSFLLNYLISWLFVERITHLGKVD